MIANMMYHQRQAEMFDTRDTSYEEEKNREDLKLYLIRSNPGSYFFNKAYVKAKLKSLKNPSTVLPAWFDRPLKAPRLPLHLTEISSNIETIPNPRIRIIWTSDVCFKIKIVDYFSPSEFSFQFEQDELKSMTCEMNRSYNLESSNEYRCVKEIYHGMHFAAFIEDSWARVEVVDPALQLFKLVDHGGFRVLGLSELYYLKESFASQSRKCVYGSLFGVKPTNGRLMWSEESTESFKQKTNDIECYATVKTNKKGGYGLEIFKDATKTKSLAKHLIAKGLAEADKDDDLIIDGILVA